MAKGSEAKAAVTKKLLEVFEGSFLYNDGKELRIPMIEAGQEVQIKVALTCAKENVECGTDSIMPGDFPTPSTATPTPTRTEPIVPTSEEKQNVAEMLRRLGL